MNFLFSFKDRISSLNSKTIYFSWGFLSSKSINHRHENEKPVAILHVFTNYSGGPHNDVTNSTTRRYPKIQ